MEIRRVGADDWQTVRAVRLRALADAPAAFASSYEREVAFADSVWIERAGAIANATFLCEHDAQPCGIVTIVRDPADHRLGWLVGMWLAPDARGTGGAAPPVRAAPQVAGRHKTG